MNLKTQQLTENQGKLNKLTGFDLALSNMFILVFDMAMLLLSAYLYSMGITDFSGFIIPLIALMSSYGPVSALANLGTTLQSTIASGGRVHDIIEETPETEEITGNHDIVFSKTVVLVSHRASTMRIADECYSIENGRLS